MSDNINVKIDAKLDEKSEEGLYVKLRSYKIDQEMNYVVAVLKLLVTNSESKNNNELCINILPKINFVAPFVTKNLAEKYIEELSQKNKLMMFLAVEKGEIVIKLEDMDAIMDKIKNSQNDTEYEEISHKTFLNMLALNWNSLSEEEKEEYAFKLGGLKGCHKFKSLLDNWNFSPEYENMVVNEL